MEVHPLLRIPSVPRVVFGEPHVDDCALMLEIELDSTGGACRLCPKCPQCDFVLSTRGVCYLCCKAYASSEYKYLPANATEQRTWYTMVKKRAELHRDAIAEAARTAAVG